MPEGEHRQNARVVSQWPLHRNQSPGFRGSHLCCASKLTMQCQLIVKLHRVFSSFRDLPGICTRIAISPSLASRQCPDRCTIRAGRNFEGVKGKPTVFLSRALLSLSGVPPGKRSLPSAPLIELGAREFPPVASRNPSEPWAH